MTHPLDPINTSHGFGPPDVMPLGSVDAMQAFASGDEGLIGAMAAVFSSTSPALAGAAAAMSDGEDGDGSGSDNALERMRRAFKEQLTDELMEKSINIADAEVGRMRGRGVTTDDGEDLVQTVLTRTWEGRLHWRHETITLLQHVCDRLRHTTRRLLALGRTNVSLTSLLDDNPEASDRERVQRVEVGHALDREYRHAGSDPVRDVALRRIAADVEEMLWNMATVLADPDVLIALGAVLQGAKGEHEISEATELTVVQARRAWRRLRMWFDEMPAGLRDQARELL